MVLIGRAQVVLLVLVATSMVALTWPADAKPAGRNADIFRAVNMDNVEDIANAILSGDDIDAIEPFTGQTPLMKAVLSGKLNAVQFLLARGANVSIGEKDGYTPMHGAGFQGRAEIAKVLIAHGLDVNDRHKDGFTPIQRACWGRDRRHTDTVRVFLEAGAQLSGNEVEITKSHRTKQMIQTWQRGVDKLMGDL
eukprot:CAMPEP_0118945348 /NCGR_PEP_ID=MMETSP1169-20130426/42074_1 /TAXON_ID=36882 /ORGANISM="Pyramimonas obovata, Strain CCMP722" /LENGTH=193 /DNA_ID=CAMNT_0006891037 /DNA_START=122 /DNA_END=703 /DNA_ORIENTATION=-